MSFSINSKETTNVSHSHKSGAIKQKLDTCKAFWEITKSSKYYRGLCWCWAWYHRVHWAWKVVGFIHDHGPMILQVLHHLF